MNRVNLCMLKAELKGRSLARSEKKEYEKTTLCFRLHTSPYNLFKSAVSSFLLSLESYPISLESFFHARRSSEYARS